MANLKIAQIQNAALKAAALEVDESGKKDGYIDSSEINLFTDKATALLNEKKCTAQEFATLFEGTNINKTSSINEDLEKFDKIHDARNSKEGYTPDKIGELNSKIWKAENTLKRCKYLLTDKTISDWEYFELVKPERYTSKMLATFVSPVTFAFGVVLTFSGLGIPLALGGCLLAAASTVPFIKTKKSTSPAEQERIRNEIKELYKQTSDELKQLKAQLAELQK